jgi:hypothetical protein
MKVNELVKLLNNYDENCEVQIFNLNDNYKNRIIVTSNIKHELILLSNDFLTSSEYNLALKSFKNDS